MTYTPNADDVTNPTDAISAESAQLEFRTLKIKINSMVGSYSGGAFTQSVPGAYTAIAAETTRAEGIETLLGSQIAGLSASAYNGNATVTDPMTTNIVLLNFSARVQTVNPQSQGLSIQLPAANAFVNAGGPMYVIKNKGLWYVWILDGSGNIVGVVEPGAIVNVFLETILTVAGQWRFQSDDSIGDSIGCYQGRNVSPGSDIINTNQNGSLTCQLSATNTIHAVMSGNTGQLLHVTGTVETATGLISGSSSPVSFTSGSSSFTSFDIVPLTATTALLVYATTSPIAVVLSLNPANGIVTAGTPLGFSPSLNPCQDIVLQPLSATSVLAVIYSSASSGLNITVFTVAGTAVTQGTNYTKTVANTATNCGLQLVMLSATLAHIFYTDTTTGFSCLRITIAGTVVTQSTVLVINATGTNKAVYAGKVSTTLSVVLYAVVTSALINGAVSGVCITDTGTTITLGTVNSNLLSFGYITGGLAAVRLGPTGNLINTGGSKFIGFFSLPLGYSGSVAALACTCTLVSFNITLTGVITILAIRSIMPFGLTWNLGGSISSVKTAVVNYFTLLFQDFEASSFNASLAIPFHVTSL